jgi:hypothetical protein
MDDEQVPKPRDNADGARPNVAVTVLFADNVNEQDAVPLQAPDQPMKLEPLPGVATHDTVVPGA